MKRMACLTAVWLLVILMLSQTALAAGSQVAGVTLNQVRQNGADLTAYITLQDEEGYPLTGNFEPESFAISVDGQRLNVNSVKSFDPNAEGIHYVFAVDTSGSMVEVPTVMQNMPAAMNAFVDNLGPLDTVSIITFGSVMNQLIVDSGDHEAVKEAIGQIVANESNTALYKGVIDAVDIANSGDGRSAVIVITDGKNDPTEEMQGYTKESIYDRVMRAQVPLYCIGLNDSGGVDTESLAEFANTTGGRQYVITSDATAATLDLVFALTRNAIEMHADLVNPDGRTDFGEASTFKVGYLDGGALASNDLLQTIDWAAVPVPVAEATPTPIPQISLELDANSETIQYEPGEKTVISGLIAVEQGTFEAEDLSIDVNDEAWRITSLMRNGDDYTFTAEGLIADTVTELNVRALVRAEGGDIASRIQTVQVIAPTATPAPVLAVELDDLDRDLLFEPGKTVSVSGTINVQGDVDPNKMELFVNGAQCDMTVTTLQTSQYEFTADVVLPEEVISDLKVQIVLQDANVRSHAQTIPLVAPTPAPDPELGLTLSSEEIEYEESQPLKLSGNIEIISGQVDQDDLALYVNSARWDMTLTALGDGTYAFEAMPENELIGDITKLDVRVRLASNTRVSSELASVAVITPEPEATAAPTPRPAVTPPPVQKPVQAQVPEETEPDQTEGTDLTMYYYIGGGVLLLLLVIVTAVILTKKKKGKMEPEVMPTGFTTVHSEHGTLAGTIRDDLEALERDATVVDRTVQGDSDDSAFIDDDADTGSKSASGTVRLDATEGSGTVRLDDDAPMGGTVRLEERWVLPVDVEEQRRNGPKRYTIRLTDDGAQVVFGRSEPADQIVDDPAVSGRHLAIYFDGEGLFVEDLGSTNGTKINNSAIAPHEATRLESGDVIRVGQTTLKVAFGKPELF